MPLVYCGACSHAPGITARADRADTQTRQAKITPYSQQVMSLEGVYQVREEAVAIRVHLKNSR
jgi:hypothetical protein